MEILQKIGHHRILSIDKNDDSPPKDLYMVVEFTNVSKDFLDRLPRWPHIVIREKAEENFRVTIPSDKDPDKEIAPIEITRRIGITFPGAACQTYRFNLSLRECMDIIEQTYQGLIEDGWREADIREVLPIKKKFRVTVSTDLSTWRFMFRDKTAPATHEETRRVMANLLKEVKQRVPVIFDDFVISSDSQSTTLKSP